MNGRPSNERRASPNRPDRHFDAGLQQERTALAWERTAFSILVAGAVLGRYAADDGFYLHATVGGLMVALGAGILIWAGNRYDALHGPLRAGDSPVHPMAARLVGLAASGGSLVAFLVAIKLILID